MTAPILCDENVKGSIVHLLEQEGFDIRRVQDELGIGTPDSDILSYCHAEGYVLLTNDDDFLGRTGGVLFLDSQTSPPRAVVTAIRRIDRHVGLDALDGAELHVPDGWA